MLTAVAPVMAEDLSGKTITSVSVTGNNAVPESTIMAVVKVKPGDVLQAENIRQDLQAIYELGYFFDVVANFTAVPEGVKVEYTVMENPVVNDIVFKGNTKVTEDKLLSLLNVTKGNILNSKALNEGARKIEGYYHDEGYILAKVTDVSMGTGGVLTITINEGKLEDIVIKGNQKTKDYVITREMKLKVGEPFNVKDARRSMQKVYNLGYFEDVNMRLIPGQDPNAVVLETSVVEQKTGTFTIGGGYSKADGLIGIIEIGDNNFRGTGDKIRLHWEFGSDAEGGNDNYEVAYTRPWLDSKQTSLGFRFFDMTNEYSDYGTGGKLISTYDMNRKGWELTLGRPAGEYIQNYITYRDRTDTYVRHVDGQKYDDKYIDENFGRTRSIILSRVFDSRDNIFNPTEGERYLFSAELAGGMLGGKFDYNKFTVEGRQYLKVGSSQVVAMRATAGYATGHMPENSKFSVGGADTLRGYEDDQFKGDKMLALTAEYRFPVANRVQGVVFTDVGRAWDEDESFNLGDMKASVGVGIRVTTPIGPIRIDYAQGSQGGRTHFSFGGQF